MHLQLLVEEKDMAIDELNQQLISQKSEYEAALNRHQNFIDQLIKDKKGLIDRNESLTMELSNSKRKLQEHMTEMGGQKGFQGNRNKCMQEKWVDKKAKRIKEHTVLAVRGLRPEIQRLLSRHNAEIADLEAEKERRLSYQERELNQQHLEHVRELRAKWEEENAEGWSHERQTLSQR